jgi:hypothetical protein
VSILIFLLNFYLENYFRSSVCAGDHFDHKYHILTLKSESNKKEIFPFNFNYFYAVLKLPDEDP